MITTLIIFVCTAIYLLSIIGAREELIAEYMAEGEKIKSGGVALTIYIPIWNTFATLIYLLASLEQLTKDGINEEIEDKQKRNFRNDLKKYNPNNDKGNNN